LPEELNDNSEDSDKDVTEPVEVKITNQQKELKWNDSRDAAEYDDIELSEEDMDI